MSNPAQAVLSIVGAGIGYLIGGPAGAAWGFRLDRLPGAAAVPCADGGPAVLGGLTVDRAAVSAVHADGTQASTP